MNMQVKETVNNIAINAKIALKSLRKISSNQKNDIVAVGNVVCVLIDYKSGKPVEIPDRLRRSMLSIEK